MSIFDPPWVPMVGAAYHPPGLQVAPKISKPATVFGMGIIGEVAAHFFDAKNTSDEYKGASNHHGSSLPASNGLHVGLCFTLSEAACGEELWLASNSRGNPLLETRNLPSWDRL